MFWLHHQISLRYLEALERPLLVMLNVCSSLLYGSSFSVFFFAFPTVLLAGCLVVAGVDNGFSPIVGLRVALSWSCQHQALGLHCSIH
jgi:hypothetical protein